MAAPLVSVNYGGGTNSTALLVGLRERGLRPDAVCFADTGGEMPETYRYLDVLREWLARVGFPELTVVKWIRSKGPHAGEFVSLEQSSLERGELPSLAYGFKGCSMKCVFGVISERQLKLKIIIGKF